MTITVEKIMQKEIVTVTPSTSLLDIRFLFEKHKFHHLLVMDDFKGLAGIVSDRDLLKHLSPFVGTYAENHLDRETLKKTAWQIMTPNPVTIEQNDSVQSAAALMLEYDVSCLPVLNTNHDGPCGILTWKDILRIIAKAQP